MVVGNLRRNNFNWYCFRITLLLLKKAINMNNLTSGMPRVDFDTQCRMLYSNDFSQIYSLFPGINKSFITPEFINSQITISRAYYKQYLKRMGIIGQELRNYKETSDGIYIIQKAGCFEMISRERGVVNTIRTFGSEDELLDMLVMRYRGAMCKY